MGVSAEVPLSLAVINNRSHEQAADGELGIREALEMVADELEETRRRESSGFVAAQPKGCGAAFSISCWRLSSLPSLGACGL